MSRTVYEGNNKVWYVPTIASKSAPTMVELAAGKDFTPYVTKDGIAVPNGQNMVDSATINDIYDAQEPGSWGGGPLTLTMFRDDTDETNSYDFITYGLRGYLVIGRFGTIGIADKVEVWPVAAHQPTLMQSAANEMQKFTAAWAVTGQPTMNAVMVGS